MKKLLVLMVLAGLFVIGCETKEKKAKKLMIKTVECSKTCTKEKLPACSKLPELKRAHEEYRNMLQKSRDSILKDKGPVLDIATLEGAGHNFMQEYLEVGIACNKAIDECLAGCMK